jgi:1-pyrroline-5-carboxylate dehydrogenase
MSGIPNIPIPKNEPVLSYAPGSQERAALKSALAAVGAQQADIPAVVGGREVRTGVTHDVVSPHCHGRVLAKTHQADRATIEAAVKTAVEAQRDWGQWRFEDRAAVFLRAAELLATTHRQLVNAATMLGQSKTAFQAEIDSACELIDFLRFNVHYAERIYREQPESSAGVWNRMDHRPLEGFVYAITPFNFTAIGGNLPTAPALMGNAVVWKPAATATLSNWHFFKLLEEAGLPPGVINFLPGNSIEVSETLLAERQLAGIHFTGSTAVFQSLWRSVAQNLER